jgi:hypothetical protein
MRMAQIVKRTSAFAEVLPERFREAFRNAPTFPG